MIPWRDMATDKVRATPIENYSAEVVEGDTGEPGYIVKLVLRVQPANTEVEALAMVERFLNEGTRWEPRVVAIGWE